MKKLSVSIFALLAIVFAVASAFTSQKAQDDLTITYDVFKLQPSEVTAANAPNYSPYVSPTNFLDDPIQTGMSSAVDLDVDLYDGLQTWKDAFCTTSTTTHVCIVEVKDNSGVKTIQDYVLGTRIP